MSPQRTSNRSSPTRIAVHLGFGALALATSAAAFASDGAVPGSEAILGSVTSLNAQSSLEAVRPSPVPGLMEVRADGQILYFTEDGQYLVAGDIYRVSDRSNVTETSRARVRAELLATSDASTHIRFGDAEAKHTVYVFTDTDCGYCQRFHSEVPALNAAGIAVEYIAWPRGGARSPAMPKMTSAWCATDRAESYAAVIEGKAISTKSCDSPIMAHVELGNRLGVQGTPAIYSQDGQQLGGYVPAARIINALKAP
ncbi:DsbC family protein [Luteimonas sp. MHLX1A]|uniref:DsbC family protein n=1 Tax=Alterluteimonas muca TaxID=2878684 RepID=UPI001E4ABD25|nr:DsbC family protein [Luteimonas sp. MHLX1A]MCD9046909.1 DsbC family protein [Luteimonas sp. MHLX1A]